MRGAPGRTIGTIVIGAVGALVGLLPWFLTGARLPLQNLWATSTMPDDMPFALLPFSQYEVAKVAAMLFVGAALGGLATRMLTRGRASGWWGVLGVAVVQVIALLQAAVVVRLGLADGTDATLYFGVLLAAFGFFTVVAVGVAALCALARPAGVLVGVVIAGAMTAGWAGSWLVLFDPFGETGLGGSVLRWLPSVIIGVAIAIVGVHTVGRLTAAVFGLVALWLTPATITAVMSGLGSRVLLGNPAEALDQALRVFPAALFEPALALPPVLVGAVIAVVGLVIRSVVQRRH